MRNLKFSLLSVAFLLMFISCQSKDLKVFQINIWQEGTMVKGGFDAIVDEIIHVDADIVLFSEVRNYNKVEFIPRVLKALAEKGKQYYGETCPWDVGVISKYPVQNQKNIFPENTKVGSVLKAIVNVGGQNIVVYSAHLDYTHYACYLPRGYSGITWKELESFEVNPDSILQMNRASLRDEAIQFVIDDAAKETAKGNIIILGGDFNEPSHLDWQADTKNLFDHNGAIVNWDCSLMLTENGFKDAFREKYPNPVSHPGFTFPSDNKDIGVNKLTWAPKADERDRIDFIYYIPNKHLILDKINVVGPSQTIVRGERTTNDSEDIFVEPLGIWPTDHKALIATFKLK